MAFSLAQPLVMVEVIPLILPGTETSVNGAGEGRLNGIIFRNCAPIISTPSAKLQLLNMSRQGTLSMGWLGDGSTVEPCRKQTHHDCGNTSLGANETNLAASDVKQSTRSRGLWLKSDLQCAPKCKLCQRRVHLANKSRIYNKQQANAFDKQIIAGDLLYHGKAEAKANSKLMTCKGDASVSVTHLRSDNPLDECGVPCYLRGFVFIKWGSLSMNGCFLCQMARHHCVITNGTIIQILPPLKVCNLRDMQSQCGISHAILSDKDVMHGHCAQPYSRPPVKGMGPESRAEIKTSLFPKLSCYDKVTIESLSLRMSTMLENTVRVGTTPAALPMEKMQKQEWETMEEELNAFWDAHSNEINSREIGPNVNPVKNESIRRNPVHLLLREGALLVHNSHSNSGKTALVTTIAQDILNCHAVHVVSAPALLAKYGTGADAALESMLHELVLRCAVRRGAAISMRSDIESIHNQKETEGARVCIVLDHLETFLPLSRQATGDPYFPLLNTMVAYLNRLSFSLKTRNEFPYPSNNPLYNVCDSRGYSSGFSLPLGICLVGIATCIDSSGKGDIFRSAIDAIGGGRFRVSLPSAATRLSAFEHSFEFCGVTMTDDAKKALRELASKATWASGSAFLDIAKKIRADMTSAGVSGASERDLKRAMILGRIPCRYETSYIAGFPSSDATPGSTKAVTFSSVGGNAEAKLALEDALALDPAKRHLLSKFGLQTPTGVLLYGPPGTGKTLLARAVAQSLYRKDDMEVGNAGGAFVTLKASDIVRPEVGNSEKIIVSAFETARLNAPSVLFIDEFQALFGDREGGGFILGQLASTLLQCMDDITRWREARPPIDDDILPNTFLQKKGRVVVLGATNTPWMVDKAFLRPGRFDRAVHVGLPTVEDREEILRVHVSKMKLASLADGISPLEKICKSMAKLCLGFSGADLAALCRAAAVRCLSNGDIANGLCEQDFTDAYVHDVMRSSNDTLVRQISVWHP